MKRLTLRKVSACQQALETVLACGDLDEFERRNAQQAASEVDELLMMFLTRDGVQSPNGPT